MSENRARDERLHLLLSAMLEAPWTPKGPLNWGICCATIRPPARNTSGRSPPTPSCDGSVPRRAASEWKWSTMSAER